MPYAVGALPPFRSAARVRAVAGLLAVFAVGACADSHTVNSPTQALASPARPSSSVSLFGNYNPAQSAHFPHIRTQVADYRIGYLAAGALRDAEFTWTAQHNDRITLDWGDAVSMPIYRQLNPTAEIYRYALNWTVIQPTSPSAPNIAATYYPDMQAWFAAHGPYQLESAFLHTAGCGMTPACRVSFKIWTDDRWAINPGDFGFRLYQRQRLAMLAADGDGLFLDEHGSGDMAQLPTGSLAEYPDYAAYQRDMVSLLADLRSALAPKRLSINTATYVTQWDADMARAAGGSHGEYLNNAFFAEMESRWTWAEGVLAGNATVDMTVGGDMPTTYTAGSYGSTIERRRLWELASYYLVAPAQTGLLYYNGNGSAWSQPFSSTWFTAMEANIGAPTSARRVQLEGTDNSGRQFRVWARDYTNALVLARPIISWSAQSYGDETAVTVSLPSGYTYSRLRADGSLEPIGPSISLRASEAAILVKEAMVVPPPPPPPPPPSAEAPILLVVDQDAMDVNTAPNYFTRANINDDIATLVQRNELRYFAANVGKPITLYSGKMGGYEGFYAPRSIPSSWATAGPTADGATNYFRGAVGQTELANVGGAVPLRATGLKLLVGKTVCAVFMRNNAWVPSFNPIGVAFQGPNLGVGAFRVDAVTAFSSNTKAVQLPKVSITILSAASTCGGPFSLLSAAPAPTNPQTPFDVTP